MWDVFANQSENFDFFMTPLLSLIRHALKPKHKIHVWTCYIPMHQCALWEKRGTLDNNHIIFYFQFHSVVAQPLLRIIRIGNLVAQKLDHVE